MNHARSTAGTIGDGSKPLRGGATGAAASAAVTTARHAIRRPGQIGKLGVSPQRDQRTDEHDREEQQLGSQRGRHAGLQPHGPEVARVVAGVREVQRRCAGEAAERDRRQRERMPLDRHARIDAARGVTDDDHRAAHEDQDGKAAGEGRGGNPRSGRPGDDGRRVRRAHDTGAHEDRKTREDEQADPASHCLSLCPVGVPVSGHSLGRYGGGRAVSRVGGRNVHSLRVDDRIKHSRVVVGWGVWSFSVLWGSSATTPPSTRQLDRSTVIAIHDLAVERDATLRRPAERPVHPLNAAVTAPKRRPETGPATRR